MILNAQEDPCQNIDVDAFPFPELVDPKDAKGLPAYLTRLRKNQPHMAKYIIEHLYKEEVAR